MSRVDLADGHLEYDDVGDGPPVVLLHDGTLDRRVFEPVLRAFPGHRVLNVDARGHGGSATPTLPYMRADDVVALLDALDIRSAVLVGQAMGGTTALDTALDHPERVAGMVLSGCGTSQQYWTSPFLVEMLRRQGSAAARGDADEYVEIYLRMWVDGPHRRPDEVDAAVRERCREMAMHTATTHARPDPVLPGRAADSWDRLHTVRAPLTALVGELDNPDVRQMAERVVAAVPAGDLQIVGGCGHMISMERPGTFADAVGRFLADRAVLLDSEG